MTEHYDERFTGWWIPRKITELYKDRKLSLKEAVLLAVVDSLSKSNEGCFASNEYLGEMIRLSAVKTSEAISKLKGLGLIVQTGFDGRKRFIKTVWTNTLEMENQTSRKGKGSIHEKVKHIVKPIQPQSKINLGSRRSKAFAPVRTNGFLSSPFDEQAAGRLKEVLVLHGSDLTSPPGVVRTSTLAKSIARLRIDRNVPNEEIRRVITFLKHHYSDQYTPKLRRADDLCVHWEKFRDAADRHETKGGEDGEVSAAARQTAGWKRKTALIDKVRRKADELGFIDLSGTYSDLLDVGALPLVLEALGEEKDAISWKFYISNGREDD